MQVKQQQEHSNQQQSKKNNESEPHQHLQENESEFDEHAQVKRNNELLSIISEFVVNSPKDNIRLTWQALYSLKRMEMDLNHSMIDEIEQIKDKYELMKQPIYSQISNLALASKTSPQNKKTSTICPQKIVDFWTVVFTKAGLLNDQIEVDMDCFYNLTSFTCEFVQQHFDHYKLNFKFKKQVKYFTNKQLQMTIKMGNQQQAAVIAIKKPIKYRLPKNQQSLFTQLFDTINAEEVSSLVTEINQCYRNALYFYFSPYHQANIQQNDEEEYPHQSSSKKIKSQVSSANKTDELEGTQNHT